MGRHAAGMVARLASVHLPIIVLAPQLYDLAVVPLRGAKARLRVIPILAVGVAVALVQNGNDAVNDVEGQLCQPECDQRSGPGGRRTI